MTELTVTYAEIKSQFVVNPPPKWAQNYVKRLALSMAMQAEEDAIRLITGAVTADYGQATSWPPKTQHPCRCNSTVCVCAGYRIS